MAEVLIDGSTGETEAFAYGAGAETLRCERQALALAGGKPIERLRF